MVEFYDLLVQLRRCSEGRCRGCQRSHAEGCRRTVSTEAADAIEELSRDLDSMNDANIALYGALPKWIPVTEKLPNPTFAREWYLVALESGCVTTLGFERETMQWHITGSPVAYWMPLPEPPKEAE